MPHNFPEFFKVFIPNRSTNQLLIPPAFVKKYKGNPPVTVILNDLNGKQWHVDVKEVEKRMYFQNGWNDFVSHNSLEYGDFLVFSRRGDTAFSVKVFGKDGCLKKNDSSVINRHALINKEDESKQEDDFEKPMMAACSRFPRACKGKSLPAIPIIDLDCEDPLDLPKCKSMKVDAMEDENQKVLDVENCVTPKMPHFASVCTRSNKYAVNIPSSLLRKHKINLNDYVELRDQNDKLWPVNVARRSDGRLLLAVGWADFRKYMKVEVNDKCLFEFVLQSGNTCKELKVQVIHHVRRMNQKRKAL